MVDMIVTMASITHRFIVIGILTASITTSLANIHYLNEIEANQRIHELFQTAEEMKNVSAFEPVLKDFHSMMYDRNLHAELLTTFENAVKEQGLSSGMCIADFSKVLIDLLAGKYYTYQVLDSIGKPPSAILQGGIMWVGSYDQCTNITEYMSSTSKDFKFQGRHCLSTIVGPSLEKISPILARTGITVGICVPNSCSNADVPIVTNLGLKAIFKLLNMSGPSNTTLYGAGGTCAMTAPWITSDIVAMVLCSVILILVVSGSVYDIAQRVLTIGSKSDTDKTLFPASFPTSEHNISNGDKVDLVDNEVNPHGSVQSGYGNTKVVSTRNAAIKGFFHQFLMSFSAITNAEKLLSTSVNEGQLGAINGIRVISMWWVILGHTYYFVLGTSGLLNNTLTLVDVLKRFSFQAVVNATYSVDSFFFLSGLLVSYLLLKELKKSEGKINWALLYFHRFWRLTPVYMFVLMMFATIAIHLPTGPFMRSLDSKQTKCQTYWWTNLLYINNFYPKHLREECMGWSWYLANDMQFFIITPPIVYLFYRFRYVGYSVVSALIAINLIVTGVIARVNHVQPRTVGHHSINADLIYVRAYHRIAPYLVGVITGELLSRTKEGMKIPKIGVVIGWCLAIASNMSVLYGVYGPNSTGIPWNDDVNALYIATSRFAWSLGLAWLTFACVTGYGGPINIFLSWCVWAPLGRLTYCAYLVHPIVIYVYYTSLRQLIHHTDYTMIYLYIPHLVIAYMVAFVVSIAVEAPMMGLEKIFKKKKD